MFFRTIELQNFRNYEKLFLKLDPHINIIVGKNGQGKTNILESLYYIAYLKSHRVSDDNVLIRNAKENFKIKAKIKRTSLSDEIKIEQNYLGKKVYFNGAEMLKRGEYIELVNVILFEPSNLEILKGSPNNRRDFLNDAILQVNSNYYTVLNDFNRLLKMRNEYLKSKRTDYDYLATLNKYYATKAAIIYQMRFKYICRLNEFIASIYKNIMGFSSLRLEYKSFYEKLSNKEEIESALITELERNYNKEKYLGSTIEGPQKDDFVFYLNDINLKEYGSQGQQRGAVIALKFAEAEILKKYKEVEPVFLLDDVFSELDGIRKNNLLKYITSDYQIILTTTDLTKIAKKLIAEAKIIKIDNGQIIQGGNYGRTTL